MFIATRFIGTKKDSMNYLFFLLTEDYIESHQRMREDLKPFLETFARDIGKTGALVRPFAGDEEATRQDIMFKCWNAEETSRIGRTPGILAIDVDFDKFDPRSNHWIHFSFRDMMDESGGVQIFKLKELFSSLAKCLHSGENIFVLADEIAKKREVQELYDSFELKPGIYGFSFDIKKGIKFLRQVFPSL